MTSTASAIDFLRSSARIVEIETVNVVDDPEYAAGTLRLTHYEFESIGCGHADKLAELRGVTLRDDLEVQEGFSTRERHGTTRVRYWRQEVERVV